MNPAKGKGSGVPRSGGSRRRAVILAPAGTELLRWLDLTARYAQQRRFDVVAIATTAMDAMHEIASGAADVIVVARIDHLLPAVEVVSEMLTADGDYESRRVRRTGRTVLGLPREDVDPRTVRPRLLPPDDDPRQQRPRRL